MFRKGTLSGSHTNPPHPESHADQAQYETDPLLDNNNHLGLSVFLFASSLLSHTLSDTQSAVAAEVSNVFLKTGGAAIIALNRGYDFGRQYSAYACFSLHRFLQGQGRLAVVLALYNARIVGHDG